MSSGGPKPFIPPFFSNFGKTNKDLFTKKFDYEHSVKVINRSTAGLTVESGAIQVPSKQLRGYTKVTYVPKERWGKVEGELHTDANQTSKISATYDQLVNRRGRVVVTAATKDKDQIFKKPAVITTEAEYTQDYVSAKVTAKSDTEAHKAEVQGSFGYDNLAIGGIAAVNQQGQLLDTNYGAEYRTPTKDLVASVYTEKNATLFNASFLQRISRDQSVGALFKHDLSGKNARSLTVGTEYRLDADTDVKVKGELPTGLVSTVIQHQLRNPRVLLGLAASFNTTNNTIAADKFGLSIQLGDF